MKIDERALEAAAQAIDPLAWEFFMECGNRSSDDIKQRIHQSREDAKAAIEAYEAARWRPIKDLPRDGTEFYVYIHGSYPPGGELMVWKEDSLQTPLGHIVETDIESLSRRRAMFRTIDPPSKP